MAVSERLDLGATSHVLMGGTVEEVLDTVAANTTNETTEEHR